MASNAVPEAGEIRRRGRQRLIGAVVMVALLVVFIPMVLDSDPRPTRPEPNATIPPKENAAPLPPPTKLVEAAAPAKVAEASQAPEAAKPAESAKGADTKVAEAPAPAPAEPAKVSAVEAPKAAAKAEPPPPSKVADAAVLKGFAVQVGAFRDEAKLKQAREKLVAAGVVHYTERLESKGGPLTRLRAGPFTTREEAEAALVKLKRATVDGKVIPLP